MRLVVLLGVLQTLLHVLGPFHHQLPDVKVVVILSGDHHGSVKTVGFQLVCVAKQQLCQLVPIIFNLLNDLCKRERGRRITMKLEKKITGLFVSYSISQCQTLKYNIPRSQLLPSNRTLA